MPAAGMPTRQRVARALAQGEIKACRFCNSVEAHSCPEELVASLKGGSLHLLHFRIPNDLGPLDNLGLYQSRELLGSVGLGGVADEGEPVPDVRQGDNP